MLRRLALPLLLAATVTPAHAVREIEPPLAVKAAFAKNPDALKNARYFAGPGNLIGVVSLTPEGKSAVVYVAPDGSTMMVGMAVDVASGRNLTAEAVAQLAPDSELGRAGKSVAALQPGVEASRQPGPGDPVPGAGATPAAFAKLSYIETGSGPEVIYALVDPLCKHCKNAYEQITQWQQKGGKSRVRWVPVSLGNERSSLKAALALGERTPAALATMFADGNAAPAKDKATKGGIALAANMSFFESSMPISATPVFVYIVGDKVVAKTGFAGIQGMASPK